MLLLTKTYAYITEFLLRRDIDVIKLMRRFSVLQVLDRKTDYRDIMNVKAKVTISLSAQADMCLRLAHRSCYWFCHAATYGYMYIFTVALRATLPQNPAPSGIMFYLHYLDKHSPEQQ